jgi:hypothetical protein
MRRPPGGARKPKLTNAYGVPIPEALHQAIESERGNLARAESVLGCLAISLEHQSDSPDPPYYPDVAQLARQLVQQSINRLDSLVLQRRLLKNKVEELSVLSLFDMGWVGCARREGSTVYQQEQTISI